MEGSVLSFLNAEWKVSVTGSTHWASSYTWIQNQIIHKHVRVDYNPLKGMLILISSLTLSTVPYSAGPESRGHSRTAWLYINVKLLPKFHCILNFVDQPTHKNLENWYPTNKSDFTVVARCMWNWMIQMFITDNNMEALSVTSFD